MSTNVNEARLSTPSGRPHITVCVCTYKRPVLLARLLRELNDQQTDGLFTCSVVVAENDRDQPTRGVVEAFAASAAIPVEYCVEPTQNIALARNRAIAHARGDFVAFIDDDEFPKKDWLLHMFKACNQHGIDGVLGPVLPHFAEGAPGWVIKGKFFDRPEHPSGMRLGWLQTRTGNVLLKSDLFTGETQPFNSQCVEGSDQEFFKRMMQNGRVFVWCNEAVAYEVVPPARWKRSFLVRRALSRGAFFWLRNHGLSLRPLATSLVAVPAYVVALPVGLALGQAKFMSYVFKLCYHAARVLAALGVNPIGQSYVSE